MDLVAMNRLDKFRPAAPKGNRLFILSGEFLLEFLPGIRDAGTSGKFRQMEIAETDRTSMTVDAEIIFKCIAIRWQLRRND